MENHEMDNVIPLNNEEMLKERFDTIQVKLLDEMSDEDRAKLEEESNQIEAQLQGESMAA
jgi:hypothetical protein